ncbi:MAG: bifunctional metallophosphatase/5'-nucleotidase [Smithellaceae bacterium]
MKKRSTQWFKLLFTGFFALTLLVAGCSRGGDAPFWFLPEPEPGPSDRVVRMTLLQTTDMHDTVSGVGSFNDYSPGSTGDDNVQGGWARLATKINEIRTARLVSGAFVLLVDSGDYNMGTAYDMLWNTDPAPFRFINTMQYDLITLGNHEFDYGPKKLAVMINKARAASDGFSIPILATNTVFDGQSGTDDDDLEALNRSGVIITDYYVKTYANGLKVGVLGLMGKTSDQYAPNAPPVTFKSDYANAAVKSLIQGKVDALRNAEGVHVVIALSHSGVTNPNGTPAGDDIILARNITGIDIIASGHDHEMTNNVIPVVNGSHTSYIICAGANGTNLAQLDFRVNMTQKKLDEAPTLTNHTINDTITGNSEINALVQAMNNSINAILDPLGTSLSSIVATSSLDLNDPGSAREFGLGNLLADSIRYVGTESGVPTIGAFANGVIRGTFKQSQQIAFADLFAIVPLGITTDDTQNPLLPGYPLLKVYLNGNEVRDLCKFDATIMAYQLFTSYFSSLSGLKCTYTAGTNDVTGAGHYEWNDYKCTGSTTPILPGTSTLYPVIIDKYTMDMLLTQSIQDLLFGLSISLHPKLENGTVIDASNLMSTRLDRDSGTEGIQEYYAWSASLKFFTNPVDPDLGLEGTIPIVPYDLSTRRLVAE